MTICGGLTIGGSAEGTAEGGTEGVTVVIRGEGTEGTLLKVGVVMRGRGGGRGRVGEGSGEGLGEGGGSCWSSVSTLFSMSHFRNSEISFFVKK